tara:strand:- start:2701 stop:3441 length:741 start_codon:yes stop_codon:yes gene_type:complete
MSLQREDTAVEIADVRNNYEVRFINAVENTLTDSKRYIRNKKRREKKKRNREKHRMRSMPNMFGVCGWWRLCEDHPLQHLANDFAKEFNTPKFPVHITYTYGEDKRNNIWKDQCIGQPSFDPIKLKGAVCKPPDDNFSWSIVGMEYDVDIVRLDNKYCYFHSIRLNCELHDLTKIRSCPYHISLAYTITENSRGFEEEWAFCTPQDIHEQWIYDKLPEKISLKSKDFTGELWDCSSGNIEEWYAYT